MTHKNHHLFTSGAAALALAGMAAGLSGSAPHAARVAAVAQPSAPAIAAAAPSLPVAVAVADIQPADAVPQAMAPVEEAQVAPEPAKPAPRIVDAVAATPAPSFADLRARVRWMRVQVNGRQVLTPDPDSRLLLVRAAAERAKLADVGLDFRDVYGVITAETSWVPRTGMGRNGVASVGLAQFEPATARALGVRNPNDPVEAVHGAALLLREAGAWSARRIAGLRLSGADYAARLREGISVYYNLSSRARQRWNGASHSLPVETRRHIFNVRAGIEQAEQLQTGTGPSSESLLATAAATARVQSAAPATVQAAARNAAPARPAVPRPVGTISWSGKGGDADAATGRAGTHVVWSDGAVTRDGGRVRWSSRTPG